MSRTDLDPACLVKALRRMAGDGGMEWCCEPIQASVLLDVADLLDENAKLRKFAAEIYEDQCDDCDKWKYRDRMYELGVEVDDG